GRITARRSGVDVRTSASMLAAAPGRSARPAVAAPRRLRSGRLGPGGFRSPRFGVGRLIAEVDDPREDHLARARLPRVGDDGADLRLDVRLAVLDDDDR